MCSSDLNIPLFAIVSKIDFVELIEKEACNTLESIKKKGGILTYKEREKEKEKRVLPIARRKESYLLREGKESYLSREGKASREGKVSKEEFDLEERRKGRRERK